jgi:hypothetical protein
MGARIHSEIDRVNRPPPADVLGQRVAEILLEVGGPGSVEVEAFTRLRKMLAKTTSFMHTEPVWQLPGMHSLPITNTRVFQITAAAPWTTWNTFLTQAVEPNMVAVIRQYVATTEQLLDGSNTQFRLRVGRQVVDTMQFTPNIEKNKELPPGIAGSFPVVNRPTFFVLDKFNPLILEVRNLGVNPVRIIAAFYGWNYVRNEVTGQGERSGAVDNQAR